MRPTAGTSAVTVLREALAGPFPELRERALIVLRTTLEASESVAEACRTLRIPRASFERLRADFPEIEQ